MTPEQAKTLAKIEQKLNDMCGSNTREHKEIKDTQINIWEKIDVNKTEVYQALNNRPRWNVIMWLMGGIFTCLLFIGGFTYATKERLNKHVELSKDVFHQITGEEYKGETSDKK